MPDDRPFTVDELITEHVSDWLGEGVLPSHVIVIVETISEDGTGLRFALTEGSTTWHAMGMLRSTLLRAEDADIDQWEGTDSD